MASTETFTIGWICAIQEVYEAACAVVDEDLPSPELAEQNDNNAYLFGRIGGHRIVIGCLPSGRHGITPATSLAKDMMASFPQLRFLFMLGTAGGAPSKKRDIRLGDVVVSQPSGTSGGVIQYDMGHKLSCEFSQSGHLNSPPSALLAILPNVKRRHNDSTKYGGIDQHLKLLSDDTRFQRPENDLLFESKSKHNQSDEDCARCETNALVVRKPRNTGRAVNVFYGTVASGNSVWKDAEARDLYCKSSGKKNVLCFEMESAGLMNDFPCIAIRGISNYADSHKNDEWNYYASAAAAAYAKELLLQVKPAKVKSLLADTNRDTAAEVIAKICHRVQRIKVLLRGLNPFARVSLIKTKILK
ncbi:nucleoside phosphorylase domain-containing protein [Trichoderma austrokoningii]